jgi:hypothetical protein
VRSGITREIVKPVCELVDFDVATSGAEGCIVGVGVGVGSGVVSGQIDDILNSALLVAAMGSECLVVMRAALPSDFSMRVFITVAEAPIVNAPTASPANPKPFAITMPL